MRVELGRWVSPAGRPGGDIKVTMKGQSEGRLRRGASQKVLDPLSHRLRLRGEVIISLTRPLVARLQPSALDFTLRTKHVPCVPVDPASGPLPDSRGGKELLTKRWQKTKGIHLPGKRRYKIDEREATIASIRRQSTQMRGTLPGYSGEETNHLLRDSSDRKKVALGKEKTRDAQKGFGASDAADRGVGVDHDACLGKGNLHASQKKRRTSRMLHRPRVLAENPSLQERRVQTGHCKDFPGVSDRLPEKILSLGAPFKTGHKDRARIESPAMWSEVGVS